MSTKRDVILRERSALKQRYGTLFADVSAALFEIDPIGINFENNTDEYEPEAGTIIPRLHGATAVQDVEVVVHEEFCRWFGAEEAGPVDRYRTVAARIWEAWGAFKRRSA
jgi:hypothetical protein